jgi:ParB family chromosome partitioning protein
MNDKRPPIDLNRFRNQPKPVGATALATGEGNGTVAYADIGRFMEDPKNPRTEFNEDSEEFKNFVQDIREHGVLQPVVVVPGEGDKLVIRYGARRLRASRLLNLPTVPYNLQTDDRQNNPFAQVSENEQRSNLSPMELARFIEARIAEGMAKQDIAKKLRRNPSDVTFLLSLAQSPGFILELYNQGKCRSPQHLYHLRKLWETHPVIVEKRCADVTELTKSFVDELKAEIDSKEARASAAGKAPKRKLASKTAVDELPITSAKIAKRTMTYNGKPVRMVRGLIVVVDEDGTEREVGGDDLAQMLLAAAATG